jgi:hypothetical protein
MRRQSLQRQNKKEAKSAELAAPQENLSVKHLASIK